MTQRGWGDILEIHLKTINHKNKDHKYEAQSWKYTDKELEHENTEGGTADDLQYMVLKPISRVLILFLVPADT